MRWKMKNEIACHCERELPGAFCVCAYLRFFCSSDVTAISHVEIHLKSQECASKRDLLRPWPDSYSEVLLLAICLHWPHAQYKGHLAPLINEDPIQCTIVRSESFQSMATYQKNARWEDLQNHSSGQLRFSRWCKNQHPGIPSNAESWHLLGLQQFWLHSAISQDESVSILAWHSGQETSVREMLLQEGDCSIHSQCFRNHL